MTARSRPTPDPRFAQAGKALDGLATRVSARIKRERSARSRGVPIRSPLDVAVKGGTAYSTKFRAYSYLTSDDLETLAKVDGQLPWSQHAREHFTSKERLNVIEPVLDDAVKAKARAGRASSDARLAKVVNTTEARLREYTFVLPLDNVELPPTGSIQIGQATLRRLTTADWQRYCGDVYGRVSGWQRASERQKGAGLANALVNEGELRERTPVLEIAAWGSPSTAYARAREDAHFAMAVLKFFSDPFSERAGQFIALKGEEQQRQNGWRLRTGNDAVGPAMWHDGEGPGLPLVVSPRRKWNKRTKGFFDALNRLVAAPPRSPMAERAILAVYWIGDCLNQPALTSEEAPGAANASALKPSGAEVGRRIRDLVTALEAVYKRGQNDGTAKVKARFKRNLEAIDKPWVDKHWTLVEAAYNARHAWTHQGIGPLERNGAVALAKALQACVRRLVVDTAAGKLVQPTDLDAWTPTP